MRDDVIRPAVFIALLTLSSGMIIWTPPVQAVPPGCTEIGTPARDVMAGTRIRDKMCTLGGGDYAHGSAGKDTIIGGSGMDTLVGGKGPDRIRGKGSNDQLFSIDQVSGNDVIRGGNGTDRCYGDAGDGFRGCEVIHTGNVPETTQALDRTVLGAVIIGEEAQEDVNPQPPPADGNFPPCTPPPPGTTSPAPCP